MRSKADSVAEKLEKIAKRQGAGSRLEGVRELCARFGVAKATLAQALEALEARGAIERRHGSGIYVAPTIGRRTIGFVFGSNILGETASPIYRMLIDRCMLREQGKRENFVFYLDFHSDHSGAGVCENLMRDVADGRLDGLVFTSGGTPAQRAWRQSLDLPVVRFLPTAREPYTVGIDYASLVRSGVRHLAQQGCQRIALASVFGFKRAEGFDEDLRAFRGALRRAGLAGASERIWEGQPPADYRTHESSAALWKEHGAQAVEAWFGSGARDERPDGIVVTDDMMCVGVLAALRQRGIRPGVDVKIATHANCGSPALRGEDAAIARIEFDPSDVVEALFATLDARLYGTPSPAKGLVVKPKLCS